MHHRLPREGTDQPPPMVQSFCWSQPSPAPYIVIQKLQCKPWWDSFLIFILKFFHNFIHLWGYFGDIHFLFIPLHSHQPPLLFSMSPLLLLCLFCGILHLIKYACMCKGGTNCKGNLTVATPLRLSPTITCGELFREGLGLIDFAQPWWIIDWSSFV